MNTNNLLLRFSRLLFGIITVLILTISSSMALAQAVTWNGGGADDNWSTVNNWQNSTPPVPGNLQQAIFSGSNRKINFNDIPGVTLKTMSLSGSGWDLDGLELTFVTDTNEASLSVGQSGVNTIRNDINMDIPLKIQGTGSLIYTGNVIGNGSLDVNSEATLTGSINNTGAITIRDIGFVNGTIGPGGTFSISGTPLGVPFLRGTGTINRNVLFGNDSSGISSTGTLTINGTLTVPQGTFSSTISAGTIVVEGQTSLAQDLTIASGATLAGDGDIIGTNNVAWLDVFGTIGAGKSLHFLGDAQIRGDGGVINGPVVFDETGTIFASGTTAPSALTFNGPVTAVGAGAQRLTISAFINNSPITMNGDLSINNSGFNTIAGTLAGTGNVIVGSDAVLSVGGGPSIGPGIIDAGKHIELYGRLDFRSTRVDANIGIEDGGDIRLLGGSTTDVNGAVTANGTTLISKTGGADGSNFNGSITIETGTLTVESDVTVRGAGAIVIQDGAFLSNLGIIELPITVQGILDGGTGSSLTNDIILETAAATGILDIEGTLTVQTIGESNLAADSIVDVEGETFVDEGSLVVQDTATLIGTGTVIAAGGAELQVNGVVEKDLMIEADALLSGNGQIVGNVMLAGVLGPGNSAGDLDLDGDVVLAKTSTTMIEIGGTMPGAGGHDRVSTTGNVELAGTLEISLIDGFLLEPEQRFTIIEVGGNLTGTFAGLNEGDSIGLVGGTELYITYLGGDGNDVDVIAATFIGPASIIVTRGELAFGTPAELAASDNEDVSIRRASSDIQSKTQFELGTTSPVSNPATMKIILEGSVFARSAVSQTIELWDFNLAAWEEVDSRTASRFVDETADVVISGDLTRFIESQTLEMKARVTFQSGNPRQVFTSNTDLFNWSFR